MWLLAFPTGDWNAKNVAKYQPATFAAMEGIFETEEAGAEIVLIGQPNMVEKKLDNKIAVPNILSFLTYQEWDKQIPGMDQFKEEELPDNVPALYYAYHIMVGLGTIFIGVMFFSSILFMEKKIVSCKTATLDYNVLISISVYRKYNWLVHRRIRKTALFGLWITLRQQMVYHQQFLRAILYSPY